MMVINMVLMKKLNNKNFFSIEWIPIIFSYFLYDSSETLNFAIQQEQEEN